MKPALDDEQGWIGDITETIRMHEKSGLLTKSQADDAIKVFNG